jgi:hypothetical protein
MFVVYGGYALITWQKKELAAVVEEDPKSWKQTGEIYFIFLAWYQQWYA